MSLRGSCLCKLVCYEVDQFDMPIDHCHCVTCRKAHAAAFASKGLVHPDKSEFDVIPNVVGSWGEPIVKSASTVIIFMGVPVDAPPSTLPTKHGEGIHQ